MNEIEFPFSELPLIIDRGFESALIDGVATVNFHPDGEWSVREIALDGARRLSPAEIAKSGGKELFERKLIALCRDSNPWLYATIIDRLETAFKDSIEDAVAKALDEDGVSFCAPNAEHSTLNRLDQGIAR